MAAEQFANNAQSTLVLAIDGSVVAFDIATPAKPFPPTGTFRVQIDDELMACSAIAGNTLTVERGTEGSTAVAHALGAIVYAVVTAASLEAIRDSVQGPTGPTGANSTVPGPTGPTGPTGANSTVPGPTGPTGAPGTPIASLAVSLPSSGTTTTSIYTVPSSPTGNNRFALDMSLIRLSSVMTGDGTVNAALGLSGKTASIITAQSITSSTALGSVIGGLVLSSLGTDCATNNGYVAIFNAGDEIILTLTLASGTCTGGEVKAYLYGVLLA